MKSIASLEQFIKDVKFPISKQELIDKAKEDNVPGEITTLMNFLPDKEFNSVQDIVRSIKL